MAKTVTKQPAGIKLPSVNINSLIKKLRVSFTRVIKNTELTVFMHTICAFALSTVKILGAMSPFGTAFFTAVCSPKNLMTSLMAVALGSFLSHPPSAAMSYVLTASVIAGVNILWNKKINTSVKASLVGGTLFLMKTAACAKGGLLAYDMIMNFGESFLSALSVFAVQRAVPVIFAKRKRSFLSFEETVSTIFVFGAMLISFNNIPPVFGIKIGHIISITVIMLMSSSGFGTAGAISGIIIGAVNSVGTYNAGAIIGAYSFSSLVASLTSKFGKTGTALGFLLANATITLFINGSTEVLINIYEILIASVLFFMSHKRLAPFFAYYLNISRTDTKTDSFKEHSAYRDRLKKTAESLNILSKNFGDDNESKTKNRNIAALINKTAEKACADCSLRYCCWNKKSDETKTALFTLLSSAEKSGKAYLKDVTEEVKNRCIRTEKLVSAFNDAYELYRTVCLWQKKVDDCKALSCAQMNNVSRILSDMSEEKHFKAEEQTVSAIRSVFDGNGIVPESISTYIKGNGSFVIEIKLEEDKYNEDIKYTVVPQLSETLGVKMRFNELTKDGEYVYVSYSMCERFCRATGAASIRKDGEKVCGDSFTSMNLSNGTYVAAISDGMGSGELASKESRKTVELLKNFLHCGFDIMHTVKLINSSLLLTGREECFSTVDLCSVNMHNGLADFVKIGGAGTYIKSGKNVEKLSYSTLPAGILKDVVPKHFSKKIEGDTLIVMVSDGVENASADDRWLEKKLASADTVNPHVIADKILDSALYYNGGKAKDDMTVVATRIWEEKNV